MSASVPIPELGAHGGLVRTAIRIQRIQHPDGELVRNGIRRLPIRIYGTLVPKLGKHGGIGHGGRILYVPIGAIVVQHHLDSRIPGIQRIRIIGTHAGVGFHFLPAEGVTQGIGRVVLFLPENGQTGTHSR